jgi:hypothetical protein
VQSDQSSLSRGKSPCSGIQSAKDASTGRAAAPTFKQGDTDTVDDAVYVWASKAEAQRGFAQLSSQATRECMADYSKKEAEQGASGQAKFGAPESGQLSIPAAGEQSAAGRVSIPYTVSGLSLTLTLDVVFVRADRGVHILLVTDATGTPDSGLEAELTRTAAQRLQTELANNPA